MIGRAELMQRLQAWRAQRWLGAMELALVRFVDEQQPDTPASLLLAVAWLGRLAAQGHVCLDLEVLADEGVSLLGWPAAAQTQGQPLAALLPVDAAAARAAWRGCAPLLGLDPDAPADAPLVLAGARLYLRRLWSCEVTVAHRLLAMARDDALPAGAAPGVAARWLDRLFPAEAAAGPSPAFRGDASTTEGDTPDLQRLACAKAMRRQLCIIAGGPGTGKTYTAARLLVLHQLMHDGHEPPRVALAAPTGKAAARLRQSLRSSIDALSATPGWPAQALERAAAAPASTLHALLGARPGTRRFAHDRRHPLALDLLVVDEASMIHVELMAALLEALPPRARLVLLGDQDQLASVEAGAVMADLCSAAAPSPLAEQTVLLRRTRRFGGAIGALARAIHAGDGAAVAAALGPADAGELRLLPLQPARAEPGASVAELTQAALAVDAPAWPTHGHWLRQVQDAPEDLASFEAWVRQRLRDLDGFRVLCALREGERGVSGLNAAIERAAEQRGWIQRRAEWYVGRPVMVTRNDAALGLFNGDIGLVLRSPAAGAGVAQPDAPAAARSSLRAWFADGDALRSVAVGRLPAVETAFALTVHKSQGSEFDHVLMVLPDATSPVLTRELLYTGITRARRSLTLAMHDPAVMRDAVLRRTRRMSGLRQRLQC